MRRGRVRGCFAVCLVGSLAGSTQPAAALAQTRAEIAAFGGLYAPTLDAADGLKHEIGPVAGLRLGSLVNPRLGFEATFAYAKSNLQGAASASSNATLVMIRSLYLVTPWYSGSRLFLTLGAGGISLAGDAYSQRSDVKFFAGSVGLGGRFRLRGRYGLRVEVEDIFYSANLAGSARKGRSDLALSVAFAVGFGPGWPLQ